MIRVDIMSEKDVRKAIRELEDIIGDVVVYVEETEDNDPKLKVVIEFNNGDRATKEIKDKADFFYQVELIKSESRKSENKFSDAEIMGAMRYYIPEGYFIDAVVPFEDKNKAEILLGRKGNSKRILIDTVSPESKKGVKYILTHLKDYSSAIFALAKEGEIIYFKGEDEFYVIEPKSKSTA